jgi:hypothetical protein
VIIAETEDALAEERAITARAPLTRMFDVAWYPFSRNSFVAAPKTFSFLPRDRVFTMLTSLLPYIPFRARGQRIFPMLNIGFVPGINPVYARDKF